MFFVVHMEEMMVLNHGKSTKSSQVLSMFVHLLNQIQGECISTACAEEESWLIQVCRNRSVSYRESM